MATVITQTANPAGVSASATVATYTGVSIGTAAPNRIIVVVVGTELAAANPSAATIDGNAMTAGTGGDQGAVQTNLFYLAYPTGTTADIAVTFSAVSPTSTQNHIAVYSVVGGTYSSKGGTQSTDMDSTVPLTTGSITIPTGGGFIAIAAKAADTVRAAWANATEDLDVDAGGFGFTTATRTTALTTTAVTCTGTTNGEDGAMSWLIFADNTSPTVALSSPSDGGSVGDTTPDLVFTGTDTDSDDVRYNIQVDQYGFNTHSLDLERGSSQYASIADASQTGLDITGDITLEAWIKLESSPASGEEYVIVSKNDYGTNNRGYGFSYFNQAGTPCLFAQISGDGTSTARNRVYANQTLSTGTWYHVAVAIDVSQAAATQFEFFLDGTSLGNGTVLENDGATSIYNNTSPFLIGCYFSSGAVSGEGTFDGLIDEVRVWNDLRTQSEISNNKNISSTYFTSGVNNFVDGWSMDNSYTSVSGSNNLTASGSPVFSTDTPFSPLINAVSGTDAGFSGSPDNSDPFTSAQAVTYTVQSALSVGTTYYWRVRAIDPSGSNAYGAWATTRSFTTGAGGGTVVKDMIGGFIPFAR